METSHLNQKNFMMSRKGTTLANKMVYAKSTYLRWGLCIPSFRAIAYVIDKQSGTCRRYLLLQELCVSSVKTATSACNSFNTSFCIKDHKTHQAISCYTLLNHAWRVKERIALGSIGIFSFLNVIFNDFSLLYHLNFNLWCTILLQVILYSV